MENYETIISKIEKLFALANNNTSAEEAQSALLKAQKLMADYNIEAKALGFEKAIKIVDRYTTVKKKKYNIILSSIIAQAFACKTYLHGDIIAMFGKEDDVQAAAASVEFISRIMHKQALNAVREAGYIPNRAGSSIPYNSYCVGFCCGLKDKSDSQTTALQIVVDQKVEDAFQTRFHGCKVRHCRSTKYCRDAAYENGYADGSKAASRKHFQLV